MSAHHQKKPSISFTSISQFGDSQSSFDHQEAQISQNPKSKNLLPPKISKTANSSFTQSFLKELKGGEYAQNNQEKSLKFLCEKLKKKREEAEKLEEKENCNKGENRLTNINMEGNGTQRKSSLATKKIDLSEIGQKLNNSERDQIAKRDRFMHKRSMSTVENILLTINSNKDDERSFSSRVEKKSNKSGGNKGLKSKPWRPKSRSKHRRNLSSHSYLGSQSFSSLKSDHKSLKPKKGMKGKNSGSKPDLGSFYALKQKLRGGSKRGEKSKTDHEFISNMKRYLYSSGKSKNSRKKSLSGNKGDSLDLDLHSSSSFLKTQKKFNALEVEPVDINPDQKTPMAASKAGSTFGAKVLGNIDKRRRQLFFGSHHSYKGSKHLINGKVKKTSKRKSSTTYQNSLISKKRRASPTNPERRRPSQKLLDVFNKAKGRPSRSNSKSKEANKKQRRSYLKEISKKASRPSFKGSSYQNYSKSQKRQSSFVEGAPYNKDLIRISNADEYRRKTADYTSKEMREELLNLSSKLNQLEFPAQLVTEIQMIFLPYIESGLMKEKKCKELEIEVENGERVIKSLEGEMNSMRRKFEEKLEMVHSKYEKLLKTESELKEEFELNYRNIVAENDELKKQAIMMNDVLKGICQEKEARQFGGEDVTRRLEDENRALYKKIEVLEDELDDMKVRF